MNAAAQRAAEAAHAIEPIQSVAVFLTDPDTPEGELTLGGAAGLSGPPLDGLVGAVGNPAHPIRRSATDPDATFDVTPMNPGGPRLRSHLPVRTRDGRTLGVVAVAHDRPVSDAGRRQLREIADRLAEELA